jgi:hypothetical protein
MMKLIVAFRNFANARKNCVEKFGLKSSWYESDQQPGFVNTLTNLGIRNNKKCA